MEWYRSWPSDSDWAEKQLDSQPHVIDHLPRLIICGQNYKTVSEFNSLQIVSSSGMVGWPEDDPGFCMLEWDMALNEWERKQFAAEALVEPREILVAPYRFWNTWSMWIGNNGGGPSENGRPIKQGEEWTDSFGLGCIYIPRVVLTEFLPVMDKFGFTDATFGMWYHEKYGQARVTWKVHPQHLHKYQDQ